MKIHSTEKKQYINISACKQTKQAILDQLCKAIQMTSAGDDLVALRYDPVKEIVHADFREAYDARQINVAMAYVQMTLYGIPAICYQSDTLADPQGLNSSTGYMPTFGYVLNAWRYPS